VGPGRGAATVRRLGHDGVRLVPGALVDDRDVLAWVRDPLVHRLAEVDPVGECLVNGALAPRLAAADTSRADTSLRDLARRVQLRFAYVVWFAIRIIPWRISCLQRADR